MTKPALQKEKGTPRRDADGLTEKQRRALPYLAVAESMHAGVMICAKLKIVSRNHFYTVWIKEKEFRKRAIDARSKFQAVQNESVLDVFRVLSEAAALELGRVALGPERHGKVKALIALLTATGVDFKTGLNVEQHMHFTNGGRPQAEFHDRLEKAEKKRDQLVERLRLRQTTEPSRN